MSSLTQYTLFPDTNDPLVYGNLPGSMTYHHIIPRNLLASFWNRCRSNQHLKFMTSGVGALIKQAYERIKAKPTGLEDSTALQVDGSDEVPDTFIKIMEKYAAGEELECLEKEGMDVIESIYQWWPANIHHGPSDRPVGDNPEEDDGGDQFEYSAEFVVEEKQFVKLKKIHDEIREYLSTNDKELVKNINSKIVNLTSITSIQPFEINNWYQVTKSGKYGGKWRIRSNS